MKRLGIAAAMLVMATTAQAQATDCPAAAPTGAIPTPAQAGQNAARDVCFRSKDIFQLLAPSLGTSMVGGGNPVLGQGGTLGGLGHFTVEVRATGVEADIPDLSKFSAPSTTPPTPQILESFNFGVGLPAVDGAIGVFKGLPLGLTNVGGIDLLLSAAYIPSYESDNGDFKVSPDQNTRFGYGVRVGLLQESLLIPGVSATWMKRDLPTTTMTGTATPSTGSSMSFTMADASVETTAWRVIASKSFILFGLALGAGQDKYSAGATFSGSATTPLSVTPTNFGPFALEESMTRTSYFANASINLLLLKIVGEVGQVTGGTLKNVPFNTFSSGAADDSRLYGSVGLRFSW